MCTDYCVACFCVVWVFCVVLPCEDVCVVCLCVVVRVACRA